MKLFINIFLIVSLLICYSCADLDLNPLSEASTETWYHETDQFEMAVNDLFQRDFWLPDDVEWIDDWVKREILSPITNATINSDWDVLSTMWSNKYKCITRANTILFYIEDEDLPQEIKDIIAGNASFVRAAQYAYLIDHWGDVVHYTEPLELEDAFSLGRTDKNTILNHIYDDFDAAISKLPVNYSEKQFATKGVALAMKARSALYQHDWAVARDAAKACMDLGVYELYPDYGELFKSTVKNPKEIIFAIPASEQFQVFDHWPGIEGKYVKGTLPRNAGGHANNYPSYEIFCAYPCIDGLPIDESPLYNPRNPFENRDPRLSETIVPFGEAHCGYIFYSHPDSIKVLNVVTGTYVNNKANQAVDRYAPYTGLLWKKGVDDFWIKNISRNINDLIVIRYADVLLMYAEAKIELNDIDQSVLDAINKVRARAYKVDYTETSQYPEVTTTNQEELRKLVRNERRIEFAFEDRRYMDIIRWRLAEKVLNKPVYGLLSPELVKERIVDKGLWFFPDTPNLDEDGIADFGPMYEAGYYRILSQRQFDASRQYLWPIPSKEILINKNMKQNPGY
jgi:starch-binding outer membrane protein, SusD/RagB family